MTTRPSRREVLELFERLWDDGDAWQLETSDLDQQRYRLHLDLIGDRRYRYALEIGCGAGAFTRELARLADGVLALDISKLAIEAAKARTSASCIEFREVDVMELDLRAEGPFDLAVLSETIYYLGWSHTFFDVAWLAIDLFDRIAANGRLLIGNTLMAHGLLDPRIVRTYRDLFLEVGFELEQEELLRGVKEKTQLDVLVSLFRRP